MIYVVGALTYCVQYLSLHNDLDKVITDERLLALAGRDSFLPEEFNLLRLPCPLGGGGVVLPCFQQMGTAELPASRAVTVFQVEEIYATE